MVSEGSMKGKATVSAKVTRADGTVEDLGVIADVSEKDANELVKILRNIREEYPQEAIPDTTEEE